MKNWKILGLLFIIVSIIALIYNSYDIAWEIVMKYKKEIGVICLFLRFYKPVKELLKGLLTIRIGRAMMKHFFNE